MRRYRAHYDVIVMSRNRSAQVETRLYSQHVRTSVLLWYKDTHAHAQRINIHRHIYMCVCVFTSYTYIHFPATSRNTNVPTAMRLVGSTEQGLR